MVVEGATDRGAKARVVTDAVVERARSAPLDEAALRDKLGQLGETPYALGAFESALPAGAIVPLSALKRARRELVAALVAPSARHAAHESNATYMESNVTCTDLLARAVVPDRPPPPAGLFALCRTLAQAEAALDAGADGVYLDFLELTGTGAAMRALRARPHRAHVGVAPPRIRKPAEEKIDAYLASIDPDAVLVRGLGALREVATRAGARPLAVGDFSLNVTNRVTASEVLARGLAAFTPSFDLDAAQLVALLAGPLGPWAEVVVHHPMPLFHMEHCAIAALLSSGRDHKTCGRPCEAHVVSLRDRAGMDHPVEADVGCRNTVFHAKAQSAVHTLPELAKAGVRRFRIELVREAASDVARLVRTYRDVIDGTSPPEAAWRSLRAEQGYGVVRGSLRVLAG
jgi:putative protease